MLKIMKKLFSYKHIFYWSYDLCELCEAISVIYDIISQGGDQWVVVEAKFHLNIWIYDKC